MADTPTVIPRVRNPEVDQLDQKWRDELVDIANNNKARREREQQLAKDREEGVARLKQYAKERGLVDSKRNADKIAGFIERNFDRLSEANVDATIQALQHELDWRITPKATNIDVWRPGDPLPDNPTPQQLAKSSVEDVVAYRERARMLVRK